MVVGGGVLAELGFCAPWLAAAVIAEESWVLPTAVVLPWLAAFRTAVATGLAWLGALLVTAEARIVAAWVMAAELCPVLF